MIDEVDEVLMGHDDDSNLGTIVGIIDNLSAGGYTARADGMLEGWQVIADATDTPKNPAIVVMTDGYANVCVFDGESCEESTSCTCEGEPSAHAVEAVEVLDNGGTTIYFVPLGAEHGQGVFGEAVQQASGEVFPAPEARDLAMEYARAYLRISGISPTVDALQWGAYSASGFPYWFEVPVEEGAGALTLLLTARNLDVGTWDPDWMVVTPSDIYDNGDPGIVDVYDDPSGSFYRILRIDTPEPGAYAVRLSAPGAIPQTGAVMAWTSSPEPGCWVAAARSVVYDDEEDLEIMVSTTYQSALESVDYTVFVIRPDGSDPVQVTVEPDADEPGMARGFLPASELHGRGTYLVTATCETSNAWFHPGESLEPDAEPLPAQRAPAFLRAASTSFFLETPDYGWLPPGGDCDGNGISDEDEGASCIDGWSYCDGTAVQCIAYGSSTCNAHPGCNWIGFPVNFCYGAPRVCESYESEQTCEGVDGCDWETPYPCPPDPSSVDTNGTGILDACDPDNTGNDVPDPWEPPWCQLEGGPCSDDADCCPGNLLCSTTSDKCYADVSFQGG